MSAPAETMSNAPWARWCSASLSPPCSMRPLVTTCAPFPVINPIPDHLMKLNKILPILLITLLDTACGSGTASEAHDHAHDHGHAAQDAADHQGHTATGP